MGFMLTLFMLTLYWELNNSLLCSRLKREPVCVVLWCYRCCGLDQELPLY